MSTICENRFTNMFKPQLLTEGGTPSAQSRAKRTAWMSKFQELMITRDDTVAGKINWQYATMLYNLDHTPEDAIKVITKESTSDTPLRNGTPIWYTTPEGADVDAMVVTFNQADATYLIDYQGKQFTVDADRVAQQMTY